MSPLYPWLEPVWQQLQNNLRLSRFSNSVLVTGQAGLGIDTLLKRLSDTLLCQQQSDEPCGLCHSCELATANTHPDFHMIEPEKAGKSISVDQIRQANRWALESSQLSGRRVILVKPAQAMTEAAANALLKTLEEPPEQCFFILSSVNTQRLLPTIVSRCQQWAVVPPDYQSASDWLNSQDSKSQVAPHLLHIHRGAPLQTQEFIESGELEAYQKLANHFSQYIQGSLAQLVEVSKLVAKHPSGLNWMWYWLTDAQKRCFGLQESYFTPESALLSEGLSYDKLYTLSQSLLKLQQEWVRFPGLNLELLVMDWLTEINEEACS